MIDLNETISRRGALGFGAAVLVAYVGVCHEVVGATLYPHGPAAFGGPVGWHAVGLSGIACGLLLVAGTLRLLRVPIVPVAAAVTGIAAVVFVGEALRHGGFHFFAFTLMLAGGSVVTAARVGPRSGAEPLATMPGGVR